MAATTRTTSQAATAADVQEVRLVADSVNRSGDPDLAFPDDDETLPPVFTDKYEERRHLKHRLALSFRIFGKSGFGEGVAGHITLRDPVNPDTFWVNPFGLDFSLITDDDLILVNGEGKVIEGGRNRLLNYGKYSFRKKKSQVRAHTDRGHPGHICSCLCNTLRDPSCPTGRQLCSTLS